MVLLISPQILFKGSACDKSFPFWGCSVIAGLTLNNDQKAEAALAATILLRTSFFLTNQVNKLHFSV
jgi:hypothetical protein